jgi:rubrerythrin
MQARARRPEGTDVMSNTRSDRRRYRRYLSGERDAAAVYRAMAERADGEARRILLGLAEAEERHAAHWADRLEELGDPRPQVAAGPPDLPAPPPPPAPRPRGAPAGAPVGG